MKREILFRGKRTDGKGWAEGFYMESIHKAKKFFIVADLLSKEMVQVDPNTVGQFTGLLDKEGNKIFEGDVVKTVTGKPMVVSWNPRFASFCLDREEWAFSHWFGETCEANEVTVIGNTHDNPELIDKQ